MTVRDSGWSKALLEVLRGGAVRVTAGIHAKDASELPNGVNLADVLFFHVFGTSTIPVRDPLRPVAAREFLIQQEKAKQLYAAALRGRLRISAIPDQIGQNLKFEIKDEIKRVIPPGLAPSTRKQHERKNQGFTPLIATGETLQAIDYEVN